MPGGSEFVEAGDFARNQVGESRAGVALGGVSVLVEVGEGVEVGEDRLVVGF